LRENCQQKSCKAFIGLSIREKVIGGEHFADTDPTPCKTPIFNLFSLVA